MLLLVGAEVMIFDFFAFMTVLLRCAHLYKVRVALVSSAGLFVMMKMSFRRMPKGSEVQSSLPDPVIFAGHFVDDVRASVTIRKAVTDHSTQALP